MKQVLTEKELQKKDNIFAITLYSDNKDILGWNKSKNFLKKMRMLLLIMVKDNMETYINSDNI